MENQSKSCASLEQLSLDGATLEPVGNQQEPSPAKQSAKFQIDTRDKNERRQLDDRRDAVRFEEPRRTGKDRRPLKNAWRPGVDI